MANQHYEQLRQLKRLELNSLYRRLDLTIGRLATRREQLGSQAEHLARAELQEQVSSLDHERKELMIEIDETEKELARYPMDNLPYPRNPDWVERNEEQQALHELLQEKRHQLGQRGGHSPVYCCCHGLPGVGKTQFVLEYAHRRLGKHYHTVVWIDGSGTDLRNATAKAARELNLVTGASPTDDQLIAALRSHLTQGGPHLVIIDNVDVPSALGRYLPRRGDVCVVVTARQKELPYATLSYRVELLDEKKSLQLLRGPEALKDDAEEQTAAKLCEYLGYLPLALMLARRVYLNGESPSFCALYESIRRVGPARWRPSVDVDPLLLPYTNLSQLFEVSYQLLGPDARWIAAAGGYFAPAPIDRDLLCDAGAHLAKMPIANKSDRDRWIVALEQIDRIGLVERTLDPIRREDKTEHVINVRIHRLLQDYLRSVTNDEDAARSAVGEALASLVKRTPPLVARLRELSRHLPHLQEVLDHHKSGEPKPALYWVVLGLIRYSCLMGHYVESLNRCDKFIPAKLPAGAAAEVISLRHQRAFALRNLREFDAALAEYQEVWLWRRQNLGPEQLETYFPQHDMGYIYLEQHRFSEAQKLFLTIGEDMRLLLEKRNALHRFDGPPEVNMLHISHALALTSLGRAELGAAAFPEPEDALLEAAPAEELVPLGVVERALKLFEQARGIFASLKMQDDQFASRPMLAQAEALRLHAKLLTATPEVRREVLSRAEGIASQALTIRQTELATKHPSLIEIYKLLGRIYTEQGDSERSKVAYEHALQLSQRREGT